MISPVPTEVTDKLLYQFLQSLRNAVNDRIVVPTYTTVNRDKLKNLQAGHMIFNSDTNTLDIWNGSSWLSK